MSVDLDLGVKGAPLCRTSSLPVTLRPRVSNGSWGGLTPGHPDSFRVFREKIRLMRLWFSQFNDDEKNFLLNTIQVINQLKWN